MKELKPYADEAVTIEIGELTVENRVDRVSIFGSVDLTKDKVGLQRARDLQSLLVMVVDELSAASGRGDLPDKIEIMAPETVKNPFA